MTWRVIVGTLSLVVTMILLGYMAITEQDRMAGFTTAYEARQVETGAAIFENQCKRCHGSEGKGIEGVAPALNAPDLFNGTRLKEIGWAGGSEDYIRAAISGGRPRASAAFANYPERMPTWSEEFGGPLRKDQIEALAKFIMNWAPAYANVTPEPTQVIEGVGTDITLQLPPGNADNGRLLAESKGCTGCHVTASVGSAWLASADPGGEGVGARAEHRFKDAGYTGNATSADQYLFESMVQPNAYVVPGFQPNVMPQTFANTLTKQDVADLIAYMKTIK